MFQTIKNSIRVFRQSRGPGQPSGARRLPLGAGRSASPRHVAAQLGARSPRALLTGAALACLAFALALASCGSSKQPSSASKSTATQGASSSATATQAAEANESVTILPRGSVAEQTIAATVEGQPITAAAVRREMLLKSPKEPVPDPPSYPACIKNLKATPPETAGEREALDLTSVKRRCRVDYEEQLAAALGALIHEKWLIGEAREEGVTVSPAEIKHEIDQAKKSFHAPGEYESYLKGNGLSPKQMELDSKRSIITNKLFEGIAKRERTNLAGEVLHYYETHKQQFTIPAGRDVQILRTTSAAAAANLKRELQSGKSFRSLAKQLSAIGQPVEAKNGEVKDLKPGFYQEPTLNNPIFSASLNRLYGPIQLIAKHKTIAPETNSGFFIFKVKAIVPARQIPLSKVRAALAKELTKARKLKAIGDYIKAFKAKWKARTDCRPGYAVTRLCKHFAGSRHVEAQEDPYAL